MPPCSVSAADRSSERATHAPSRLCVATAGMRERTVWAINSDSPSCPVLVFAAPWPTVEFLAFQPNMVRHDTADRSTGIKNGLRCAPPSQRWPGAAHAFSIGPETRESTQ